MNSDLIELAQTVAREACDGRVHTTDLAVSAPGTPWDEHGEAFLSQLSAMTPDQWDAARASAWTAPRVAARDAARTAARIAARDTDWYAARDAARDATQDAAWDDAWDDAGAAALAAVALVVRDLISTEHYDTLTRPMRLAGITVHPDDPEVTE